MTTVTKRTYHLLRLFAVIGMLLAVPFVTNAQHAAALQMNDHPYSADMSNCASYCAERTNGTSPQQAVLDREEIQAPDPVRPVYEPYYLKFQKNYSPKVLRPSNIFGVSPIRPPDIVKLSANFRF